MSWNSIKPFSSNKVQSSDRIILSEIFKRVKNSALKNLNIPS